MNDCTTLGWSIDTWHKNQIKSNNDIGLQRLIDLITVCQCLESCYKSIWIHLASRDHIYLQWTQLQQIKDAKKLPLYGVPFAVKDNIDVEDFPTTAACPTFEYKPTKDSTVVQLLKAAGAICIGKTNLDQFATGLVGTRSPYGRSPSVFSKSHISGGSSSGSAVATALGLVPFALGTDTAGSGRVPAQFNNLIGVKPTRGIVSTTGVVPACRTLDCVSIFTLCLSDAELVLHLIAKYDEYDPYSRQFVPNNCLLKSRLKFAVPDKPIWFDDVINSQMFLNSLKLIESCNIELIRINFQEFYDLAELLYDGPWVAERYCVTKSHNLDTIEPVVRNIINNAKNYSATDYFEAEYKRKALQRQIDIKFEKFDGLIVPTAPIHPQFDDIDQNPIVVNTHLGTYTNFVNLADMAAIALPAGFRDDSLPFGITLISKQFTDFGLLSVAQRYLTKIQNRVQGVKFHGLPDSLRFKNETDFIKLGVVGAHLNGMPLNYQLTDLNGWFHSVTTTSANYELYVLPDSINQPISKRKPGLKRNTIAGSKIEIEIWQLPKCKLGEFIELVQSPLAIGSIELDDGSWIKGFICESIDWNLALNISQFGGWRGYVAQCTKQI